MAIIWDFALTMYRVALFLTLTIIAVVGTLHDDENIRARFEQPLGGIQELTEAALQSDEARKRVELALEHLSNQKVGCLKHRPIKIRSGSRQVVNGFIFVFVVEVESFSVGECDSAPGVSEVYKVTIYEPAARDRQTEYSFEKLSTTET
ncbi:unnamed protein product [Mesocestoides corti]|nr:unnamed protein product [Mesocestoides corti]